MDRPRGEIHQFDALIIVDVQNDFCAGGALAVPRADEALPLINRLAAGAPHVILTQDWHPPGHVSFASSHAGKEPYETILLPYGRQVLWPDHCVQGTEGARFHPRLEATRAGVILRKGHHPGIDSYSAFFENDRVTPTGLAGYLRERGLARLLVAGLATDFCVQFTSIDARRLGFEVAVAEDACRAIDLEGSLAAAWTAMLGAGVLRVRAVDLASAAAPARPPQE